MHPKLLLNAHQIDILLHRLACQLIEKHLDFSKTVLIGLQPRGAFFRDDFRRTDKPHAANATQMNVSIEDKCIVFIDDVLYTGRSIRAALTAIESYGRPKEIELLTFIDRRFSRHLPIQPDYVGRQIDSLQNDKVEVKWKEITDEDAVYLIKETL